MADDDTQNMNTTDPQDGTPDGTLVEETQEESESQSDSESGDDAQQTVDTDSQPSSDPSEPTEPIDEPTINEPEGETERQSEEVTKIEEAEVSEPAGDEIAASPEVEKSTGLSPRNDASGLLLRNDDSTDSTELAQSDSPVEGTTKAMSDQGRWYVVHTYAGHENKVLTNLKQRIETEHLENKIFDILVPTQDKIEIRSGKKEQVKEKIFPGYILVKMILDDASWLAVRTTQGVTSFVGMGNKPTPISEAEVKSIVRYMNQGAPATFKDVFLVDDTVKIIDGPFAEFIGKVDSVDKEHGKLRVLVSIFGRETPVELDFLQVQKL